MSKFTDLIDADVPVLVDFFATWCGPCKMMVPVLKEVKDSLGDRVTILKIDVDKNEQLAEQYRVRSVPTMLLFQNGRQLWRQAGMLSKEDIISSIVENTE